MGININFNKMMMVSSSLMMLVLALVLVLFVNQSVALDLSGSWAVSPANPDFGSALKCTHIGNLVSCAYVKGGAISFNATMVAGVGGLGNGQIFTGTKLVDQVPFAMFLQNENSFTGIFAASPTASFGGSSAGYVRQFCQ